MDGAAHPDRVIVGTETFPHNLPTNWAQVEKLPYLIGDFMWTAWDYIGEIGLGAWYYSDDADFASKNYPWKLNGGGAIDLIGNPTGEALWAKAIWSKDNNLALVCVLFIKNNSLKLCGVAPTPFLHGVGKAARA
jgi:beta-galactosidase